MRIPPPGVVRNSGPHFDQALGTLNFLKVKIAAGVKKAAGPIAVP